MTTTYSPLSRDALPPPTPASDAAGAELNGTSVLQLLNLLLAHGTLLWKMPMYLVIAVIAITVVLPRHYATEVSFTPIASDLSSFGGSSSPLSGLAAQFGVSIPGQASAQSPEFYQSLVESPTFLRSLAETRYRFRDRDVMQDGTFIDLYEFDESTKGKTIDKAVQFMANHVLSIRTDDQTGIVAINVRTEWPALSEQMARRIVALVDEYNLGSHQHQAAAQQAFMQQRLDTARAELRNAENALQEFLQRNRTFKDDPQLAFQYDRLQREMSMRQDLYTTVMQGYEQARIEAARNTPSIALVEPPTMPLRAERMHLAFKALFATLGGLVLAMMLAVISELVRAARQREPEQVDAIVSQLQRVGQVYSRTIGRVWRRRARGNSPA